MGSGRLGGNIHKTMQYVRVTTNGTTDNLWPILLYA